MIERTALKEALRAERNRQDALLNIASVATTRPDATQYHRDRYETQYHRWIGAREALEAIAEALREGKDT